MNNEEQRQHWREILNKEWSRDFPTLTVQETQKMIRLAFYQLFLIEVDSIKIISEVDGTGHYVKFEIEGEAFIDEVNTLTEEEEED